MSDTLALVYLAVFLLLFFVLVVFIAAVKDGFQLRPLSGPQPVNLCPPGDCATLLRNGDKRCPPSNNQQVIYDPGTEVCNGRFTCDHPATPYSLQPDGSTNLLGICPVGVQCPCLNYLSCPRHISSAFAVTTGNPFQNEKSLTFQQVTSEESIRFNDPSKTFCAAPDYWLPLIGTVCSKYDKTPDSLVACMATSGFCSSGSLAFLTDDPESITKSNFSKIPLGCVKGNSCPGGLINVFDTNYGRTICRKLS